jgi:hypothetical protein
MDYITMDYTSHFNIHTIPWQDSTENIYPIFLVRAFISVSNGDKYKKAYLMMHIKWKGGQRRKK